MQQHFNPRTPYRVRHAELDDMSVAYLFQSTHSIQSATQGIHDLINKGQYFNPRTPYRVRRNHALDVVLVHAISIHALHTECDETQEEKTLDQTLFQSTHSIQSATFSGDLSRLSRRISIHALHTECDYIKCHIS
ncbi:hypothetical protein PAEAM_28260 [Paenibacillus sp. GM1FR]|nr:hypothetical protein PAEAM_28260 [Paenibacillus sp. GM1FR]